MEECGGSVPTPSLRLGSAEPRPSAAILHAQPRANLRPQTRAAGGKLFRAMRPACLQQQPAPLPGAIPGSPGSRGYNLRGKGLQLHPPCPAPSLRWISAIPRALFRPGTCHQVRTRAVVPCSPAPAPGDCNARCPAQGRCLGTSCLIPRTVPWGLCEHPQPPRPPLSPLLAPSGGVSTHVQTPGPDRCCSCWSRVLVTISWCPSTPRRHTHPCPSSPRPRCHLLCWQRVPATGHGSVAATRAKPSARARHRGSPRGLEQLQE